MGSRKRNRRRSGKKPLRKERQVVEVQEETIIEGSFDKRTTGKLNLHKNILIVCEGETEAAYFFALKDFLDRRLILGVEILPDLDTQSENRGSGVSALPKMLDLALEKMQEKDYSEVWMVLDNDEGNAYKLDNASIDRIRTANPTWAETLETQQNVALNVREDEEEKERIRYFLDRSAYENFLSATLPGSTAA